MLFSANWRPNLFNLACVICWLFWYIRNQVIHDNGANTEADITWSMDFLEVHGAVKYILRIQQPNILPHQWKAPFLNALKINVDYAEGTPEHY